MLIASTHLPRDKGPLGPLASYLLRPASWAYSAVVAARNRRFDLGRGVKRLPLPVISIGNLIAGGTGKTPMVAWTALKLAERGHRAAIVMRGYGAAEGTQGDEEREYGIVAPSAPVIASPDRLAAVTRFVAERPGAIDCVILDDGFQHRQLARDLDVVLVDAERPALDGATLPCGWLREAPSGLRRAGAVVVTRAKGVDDALGRHIASLHGRAPLAWCRHAWRAVDVHADGAVNRHDISWLRGLRVLGVFGVGNPGALRAAYRDAGTEVVCEKKVRDHAPYARADLERWIAEVRAQRLDAIATTRKDWMKLAELVPAKFPPIIVPDLAIEFIAGESEFARLVTSAASSRR